MNILHHKSWHVYNKTNIEKVRQDEEKARQEEKEKQDRAIAAEKEYRLQQLRLRAKGQPSETVPSTSSIHDESSKSSSETITSIVTSSGHINFFADAEKAEKQHIISTTATNPEYEAEKKAKEKKYEKQFTKYLDEFDKAPTPWYLNYDTKVTDAKRKARDDKEKTFEDPLSLMNSYLSQKKSYDDTVRPDHHLALPAPPPVHRTSHVVPAFASKSSSESVEQKLKRSRRVEGGDDKRRTKKDSRRKKIKKRQKRRRTKSSDEDSSNSSSDSSISSSEDSLDDSESSSSSSSHYTSDSDTDTRSQRSHRKRKNRSSSHHKSKKSKSHKSSKLSTSSKPDLSSSSSTSKSISQLRAERLRRESEERSRLSFVNPSSSIQPVSSASSNSSDRRDINERTAKYNNQFNPHMARHNVNGSNRRGGMGRGEKYVDRYR